MGESLQREICPTTGEACWHLSLDVHFRNSEPAPLELGGDKVAELVYRHRVNALQVERVEMAQQICGKLQECGLVYIAIMDCNKQHAIRAALREGGF